jgi:lysine 6-dehydrogenase
MRLVVVGGGMQGHVIASNLRDRKEKPEVIIADIKEPASIPHGVRFEQSNVLDQAQVETLAKDADALVLAVPSQISHAALSNLIRTGKPVVDVSLMPDPALALHAAAQSSGSCCVFDCGVAPGLSHILVGSAYKELGGLDSVRIMVGGMPQDPPPVFRHAIYFNPHDLISEYVRPARARQGGKEIAPRPLEVPIERFKDAELGNLDAILSDGLRSLLTTYPDVADMNELTLRWPGHIDAMKTLGKIGLFEDATAAGAIAETLSSRYPAAANPDVLLMIVEVKRKNELRSWRMIDRFTDGLTAINRTTGFMAAAVAMLLARRQFSEPGVHPPERLGGEAQLTRNIIQDLNEHGINVCDTTLVTRP